MNFINSKDNKKIKYLKKIRDDSKFRKKESLFFVEGERILKDMSTNEIYEIYISDAYNGFVPYIQDNCIYKLSNNVFNDIKDTKNSQGIVALVKFNKNYDTIIDFFNNQIYENDYQKSKILLLDGIQDPGNMGTIIRTTEASGIKCILLFNNCVDIYSPKVVRSSMGSIKRISFYESKDKNKDLLFLKENYTFIGSFLNTNNLYSDKLYDKNVVIVVGNEGNGISKEIENFCDKKIKIPMEGKIESLNVSIATAIILYEVKKQNE